MNLDVSDIDISMSQNIIEAYKMLKENGYKFISNFYYNVFRGSDIYEFFLDIFNEILEIIFGATNVQTYYADKENSLEVGYEMFKDPYDEKYFLDMQVFEIHDEYVDAYLKLLGDMGVNSYGDSKLTKMLGITDNNYYDEYQYTEGFLGRDHNGLYYVSTECMCNFEELVSSAIGIKKYCKEQVKKYRAGKRITINSKWYEYQGLRYVLDYSRTYSTKKRVRSWSKYRDRNKKWRNNK